MRMGIGEFQKQKNGSFEIVSVDDDLVSFLFCHFFKRQNMI